MRCVREHDRTRSRVELDGLHGEEVGSLESPSCFYIFDHEIVAIMPLFAANIKRGDPVESRFRALHLMTSVNIVIKNPVSYQTA